MIPALIQASVLYLPGRLAVAGFLPSDSLANPLWQRVVVRIVLSLALGLVLNAWGAFVLGSFGVWTGLNALLFPWIPALLLWAITRRPMLRSWRELVGGWGLACLLFVVVHLIPARSEWMVGGWDPGIYTNEALALVRTGSLEEEAHPFARALGRDVLAPVIRSFGTHTELFPGVPINPSTGSVSPSFPRMSTAFMAGAGRWMGTEGVFKAPLIFALLALMSLGTLALLAGLSPWQSLAIMILMVGQPLFIHYAVTPSSEMIELLLMTVGLSALWLAGLSRRGWLLLSLMVVTLAANRTSFLLFGSLGLVGLAVKDWLQPDRRQVLIRHGAIGVSLWLGHFILGCATPLAIYKLAHVLPRIYMASLMLMGLTLILDGLATRRVQWNRVERVVKNWGRWVLPACWALLMVAVIVGTALGWEMAGNFRVWVAYAGVFGVAAAAGGSWGPALRRFPVMGAALVFLGAALTIVLWQKHAAELYPWALKRFLPWGVPLVALGASFFCVDWARRFGRDGLACVLAVALVAPVGPLCLQAWKGGEYVGVSRALQAASGKMGENTWVICDHFQWATPLWFAYGIPTLDAHRLIETPDTPQAAQFWNRVADLRRQGQPIYLLSSNDSETDPWAAWPGGRILKWRSGSLPVSEIHQHASNRDFPIRTIPHEFKLYEWTP